MASAILQVVKLSDQAICPTRASSFSAGYDLYSPTEHIIKARGKILIKLDLKIKVPLGTYGRIAPRSGLAWNNHIDVGAGVVDSDYTGNVAIVLFNHGDSDMIITAGMRIAQLICEKIEYPALVVCDTLEHTIRGSNGFGSSGLF